MHIASGIRFKKAPKIKNFPTKLLKEILNDPYCRTSKGTDYEEYKDEMQKELWRRERVAVDIWDKPSTVKRYNAWRESQRRRLLAEIAALRLCPPEDSKALLEALERLKYDVERVSEQTTCPFLWACVKLELQPHRR